MRICMGVAAGLCGILLAKADKFITSRVEGTEVVKSLRYVDDIHVVFGDNDANAVVKVKSNSRAW